MGRKQLVSRKRYALVTDIKRDRGGAAINFSVYKKEPGANLTFSCPGLTLTVRKPASMAAVKHVAKLPLGWGNGLKPQITGDNS